MGKFFKSLISGLIAGAVAAFLIGPEAAILAFLGWFLASFFFKEKKPKHSSSTPINRFRVPEEKRCPRCGGTMYHGSGNKKWHCQSCRYKEDYYK
jgi:ribosomal protein S27AE